jgi:argininosuccinate synthase
LNEIGGRNGVGRIDMVENRFRGHEEPRRVRGPGMTILYDSLRVLEQITSTAT